MDICVSSIKWYKFQPNKAEILNSDQSLGKLSGKRCSINNLVTNKEYNINKSHKISVEENLMLYIIFVNQAYWSLS